MKNPIESLKNAKEFISNSLNQLVDKPFEKLITIDIVCEKLAPFEAGCHGTDESDNIFNILHNNNYNDRPAVYWFEITSAHSAEQIREHFHMLKDTIGVRSVPTVTKKYDSNSKILYVGKGKGNISGRMFLHLGYERKKDNLQGLQLCHWNYSETLKGLTLRLNIAYFPIDFKEIVPYFERSLAKDIHPILGKHL